MQVTASECIPAMVISAYHLEILLAVTRSHVRCCLERRACSPSPATCYTSLVSRCEEVQHLAGSFAACCKHFGTAGSSFCFFSPRADELGGVLALRCFSNLQWILKSLLLELESCCDLPTRMALCLAQLYQASLFCSWCFSVYPNPRGLGLIFFCPCFQFTLGWSWGRAERQTC